jgi:hypothetical protein
VIRGVALLAAAAFAFLASPAVAHPTWGIAADASGQVWFSQLESVWRIDARGGLHLVRPAVEGRHVHELRLDASGNLTGEELSYDSDAQLYHSAIWEVTPSGASHYLLAPTTSPPVGYGIWSDRAGNRYQVQWNDNERRNLLVFRRAPDGRVTRLLGSAAQAAGYHPTVRYNSGGFAIAADGSAWFTDRASLYAIAPGGAVRRLATLCEEEAKGRCDHPANLRGIVLGLGGSLYVADAAGRRVLRREPGGRFQPLLASEAGWSPHGVALSAEALFVLEFTDHRDGARDQVRVRKMTRDGRMTVLAQIPAP